MSQILNSLLQMYFGAKLYQKDYVDYVIKFTSGIDAIMFTSENKWLDRFFYITVRGNIVKLNSIMDDSGYKVANELKLAEEVELELYRD